MNKNSGALARRYGTALFETLVKSSKDKTEFQKNTDHIRKIYEFSTKKILTYFSAPSLTIEEKFQTLECFLSAVFHQEKISNEILSFLKLLLENKRFEELKPIFNFFFLRADTYLEIAHAVVTSAREISQKDLSDFESALHTILNKKIIFKTECDETLKSGFIVQFGNVCVDASFKSRLNALKGLFL